VRRWAQRFCCFVNYAQNFFKKSSRVTCMRTVYIFADYFKLIFFSEKLPVYM